jgi:LmbE family N-acetylglucosaminyl deacetylase
LNVVVVAAHPDDEVLGCGGTMARHVAHGDHVTTIIVAEGSTSRQTSRDRQSDACNLYALKQAALRANAKLGVDDVRFLEFPDNRLDGVHRLDLVKALEQVLSDLQPDCVYTHSAADLNIDHQLVHEAVLTACRPVPGQVTHTILCFEVASSTEWRGASSAAPFVPNWFVDISAHHEAKVLALQEYTTEMRAWPHARSLESLEALAKWRGATIGVGAAEAFQLARHLR